MLFTLGCSQNEGLYHPPAITQEAMKHISDKLTVQRLRPMECLLRAKDKASLIRGISEININMWHRLLNTQLIYTQQNQLPLELHEEWSVQTDYFHCHL